MIAAAPAATRDFLGILLFLSVFYKFTTKLDPSFARLFTARVNAILKQRSKVESISFDSIDGFLFNFNHICSTGAILYFAT